MRKWLLHGLAAGVLCIGTVCSALEMPEVFSDNMMLQRGKPVPVWGKTEPGAAVEVQFDSQTVKTSAGLDGSWEVVLAAMDASGKGKELSVRSGKECRIIKNVLVGEVWLAGGQSNMDATFYNLQHDNALEKPPMPDQVDFPDIRLFTVAHRVRPEPVDPKLTWKVATQETVYQFSGTAFYFAKELHEELNVPVGIICCAWGGTYAESWVSAGRLLDDVHCQSIFGDYAKLFGAYSSQQDYEKALVQYRQDNAVWSKKLAQYRKTKDKKDHPGTHPQEPVGNQYYPRPCGLYESMFQTVVPYGISGIIFYQGESNAQEKRGYQYRFVLKDMIENWRDDLHQGHLPFLIVQLPTLPNYGGLPELRESQFRVYKETPNCGLAVLVGDDGGGKLHPPDKAPVGHRLALWALKLAYGKNPEAVCGPLYESFEISGNKIIVRFAAGTGVPEARGGELKDFELCGADRNFVPAKAVILPDNSIEVSCGQIQEPVAARYGWKNSFVPTLFNKNGLPASPFTTE